MVLSIVTLLTRNHSVLSLALFGLTGDVQLIETPWTEAHEAPLSMKFSRPEYWSRLPFPSPGDLPDPGIELACLMSAALAGIFFSTKPWQQIIANNSMGYHSPSFARKTRLNLLKARIKTFFPASVSSRVWL